MTALFKVSHETGDFSEYGSVSDGILWDATRFGAPGPARLQIASDQARLGSHSLRVELHQGDGRYFNAGVPASADSAHIPSEISTSKRGFFKPGEVWWFRHSVLIPAGSDLGSTYYTGLEFHAESWAGGYGGGFLYFKTDGGRWFVITRGGDPVQWETHTFCFDHTGNFAHTQTPNGGGGAYTPPATWLPSPTGVWVDFLTRWLIHPDSGVLQLWMDVHDGNGLREVIPEWTLPTIVKDKAGTSPGVYASVGIYRPSGFQGVGVIYLDELWGAANRADLELDPPALTDAQLRDQAVAHLKKTTVSYPSWLARQKKNPGYDAAGSEWGKAFDALARIGGGK